MNRCEKDHQAYLIAKQNHPTPEFNCRGEPQWNGSAAQVLLKELVEKGEHKGVEPKILWSSREEYQMYSLKTFCDHIYQEERLLKFFSELSQHVEKAQTRRVAVLISLLSLNKWPTILPLYLRHVSLVSPVCSFVLP